jgi:hypothetical protein
VQMYRAKYDVCYLRVEEWKKGERLPCVIGECLKVDDKSRREW